MFWIDLDIEDFMNGVFVTLTVMLKKKLIKQSICKG